MGIGVLCLGQSGTGKSYGISGLNPDETKIISVKKPILPFRKQFELVVAKSGEEIIAEMKNTKKKVIVIDDFQYLLGVPMMKRVSEKGWEKFNEIQQPYSDVLESIDELPSDTIVIFISHTETDDNGNTKIKTIGKALDKYITIEGLFMIVLGTSVIDGKYYYTTQNNGSNTVKSPEGMFPGMLIPNDYGYVVEHIRNYYYMDGSKSDSEMEQIDKAVSESVPEVDNTGRKVRKPRSAKLEQNDDDLPFIMKEEPPKDIEEQKEETPVQETRKRRVRKER